VLPCQVSAVEVVGERYQMCDGEVVSADWKVFCVDFLTSLYITCVSYAIIIQFFYFSQTTDFDEDSSTIPHR